MYVYLTKQELNSDIKSQNSYMNDHSSNLKRKKKSDFGSWDSGPCDSYLLYDLKYLRAMIYE